MDAHSPAQIKDKEKSLLYEEDAVYTNERTLEIIKKVKNKITANKSVEQKTLI